jgi:predicted amidohydrolase YtcJ
MARLTAWIDGEILTMDPVRPRAEALLVRGEEIIFVGSSREVLARAGDADLRKLGGAFAMPGFNDNHVHALLYGDHALAPDLGGLDGRGIVGLLRERFPDPGPGEIIRAFNWDYPACPDPRKELLDAVFPRNPVVLSQFSGHAQWMNSAALRTIGIRRGGPEPRRGQVLRDADGEPTGLVRDLGDSVLQRRRYRSVFYDPAMRERRLAIALEEFRRNGVCSVQDNAWFYPQLFTLARWAREGRLTARFGCWSLGRRPWTTPALDAALALGCGVPDRVEGGPVKYFVDGAFSTRSAYLFEPYADATEGEGEPARPSLTELPAALARLARLRKQGAFHAIGDRGVSLLLDAVENAWPRHPILCRLRIRIEHAQLIREGDIERIARLGLLVSAQPSALADPEKDLRLLGAERAERAYPYRSLLDAGVPLSFGSDLPGESSCDPLLGVHRAVNRPGPERIGVEEALACYTRGSAHAQFAEGRKGSLAPGMLADFVILSGDPTAVPVERIKEIRVAETVVGGESVWRRGPAEL